MIHRLLCDVMLAGLARWLRAAGHDTTLAQAGEGDGAMIDRCEAEGRVLVSRDRDLARAASARVGTVLLTRDDVDGQALALARALELDWTLAPFTRCMMDNTPLRAADESDMAGVPEQSRALPGPFTACPACGRVYWPGSHVRRMTARLRHWRALAEGGGADSVPDTED